MTPQTPVRDVVSTRPAPARASTPNHAALVAVPDAADATEHTIEICEVTVGFVAPTRQVYYQTPGTRTSVSPEAAIEIGRWLVAFGQRAAWEPNPKLVGRLAEFLDAAMDASPEELARALLSRFAMTDREPTP